MQLKIKCFRNHQALCPTAKCDITVKIERLAMSSLFKFYITYISVFKMAGTIYPSGHPELTPIFGGVRIVPILCLLFNIYMSCSVLFMFPRMPGLSIFPFCLALRFSFAALLN